MVLVAEGRKTLLALPGRGTITFAMRLKVRDNRVDCPQRGAVDVERCCACSWCDGVDGGAVQCSHSTFRFGADLDLLRLGIVPTTRRTGQTF